MLNRHSEPEKWLRNNPVDDSYLRPYQRDAISSIEEAILADKLAVEES